MSNTSPLYAPAGQVPTAPAPTSTPTPAPAPMPERPLVLTLPQPSPLDQALMAAGTAIGAYHGYRRNGGSIGWALGWGLLGGMFPVVTSAIAIAQGLGEPATRGNPSCSTRRRSR